jgi:hypothetical protein
MAAEQSCTERLAAVERAPFERHRGELNHDAVQLSRLHEAVEHHGGALRGLNGSLEDTIAVVDALNENVTVVTRVVLRVAGAPLDEEES